MESLVSFLSPCYEQIKFLHVVAVMIWFWSASIAYMWVVRVAWNEWKGNPDDPVLRERRNWVFEQYDKGLEFEHGAMVLVFITGPLLLLMSPIDPVETTWMFYKLLIAFLVFLPLELIDCFLAHFHGNKKRIREKKDADAYEKAIQLNWLFLQISAPIVAPLVLVALYLAIVKPVF